MSNLQFDYERFNRLLGIFTEEQLLRFSNTHILLVGVGGSGGQMAVDLARMGFGHLTLMDPDVYERHNSNRQIGCFEHTLGKYKVDVIAEMCEAANPRIKIYKFVAALEESNIAQIFANKSAPTITFVAESIDGFAIDAKILLHQWCRRNNIIAMTAPMIGLGAALFVFKPESKTFEECFLSHGKWKVEKVVPHLGSYISPLSISNALQGRGNIPTCGIGATLASSLMVAETVKGIIAGKEQMLSMPDYLYLDVYDQCVKKKNLFQESEPRARTEQHISN